MKTENTMVSGEAAPVMKRFLEEVKGTKSVFDLSSLCISMLEHETSPRQAEFVSSYCQENMSRPSATNPNLTRLSQFADEMYALLKEKTALSLYGAVRSKLSDAIKCVELSSFGEVVLNDASILYFLLIVLDQCAALWRDGWTERTFGPLNRTDEYGLALYFIQRSKLLDETKLRTVPEQAGFNEHLHNLAYLRRRDWPEHREYPVLVGACPALEELSSSWKNKTSHSVRIAIIPFGVDMDFSIETTEGTTFRIAYPENDDTAKVARLIRQIDEAIRQKAHFILLPEYAVSPSLLAHIRVWLSQQWIIGRPELQHLVAVLAGSTWIREEHSDNNVMHLVGPSGKEYGPHYKAAPFRKSQYDIGCEKLTNPGKHSTLLFVKGLGLVQPSVCRDVVDRDPITVMTYLFHPSILMTASYSHSVNGFLPTFTELATQRHCVCLMGNHCAAIEDNFRKSKRDSKDAECANVGLSTEPVIFKPSRPSARSYEYSRTHECYGQCKDAGCVHIADLDFSTQGAEEKRIVSFTQITCDRE